MKKQILLLVIFGVLSSCSGDDDQTQIIEMRVNHFQTTGFSIGPVLTLLVQKGDNIGTDNWTKFYSNIQGFAYEPGIVYSLSVKTEQIDNPPADGFSVKYTLLEVISKQEVDKETTFDIDLKVDGESFITTESGLKLLNQIDIDCSNLCDLLETTLQNQDFVIGTFKHISGNGIQLIELK